MIYNFKDQKKRRKIGKLVLFVMLVILDNIDSVYLNELGRFGAVTRFIQTVVILYLGISVLFRN